MKDKCNLESCRTQDHNNEKKHQSIAIRINIKPWQLKGTQDHSEHEKHKTMVIRNNIKTTMFKRNTKP